MEPVELEFERGHSETDNYDSYEYPTDPLMQESFLNYPYCPCETATTTSLGRMPTFVRRWLNSNDDDEEEDDGDNEPWEIAFTSLVLCFMFLALISDRFGADSIMLASLTAFLASQIISVKEGLEGFANEGLWAVMILFVVAEGIGKTGALDWYMQKLLGHPKNLASAQLRLMIPIALVSAFLNNTPVVVVMIPIVQRWAKNIRQSPQQLLIPLSFASILGGTCTLIGTSTNLVVTGLLEERYSGNSNNNNNNNDDATAQDEEPVSIGLFDLGQFGVPVAMAGVAYILIASPFLLPGGNDTVDAAAEADELLLGARLTQWSPAVNRTVQRSGLRDTGGIYLVSVHRAATGNVHRAVSQDFVLNVGDILYFTGHNVENFGDFCADNGLEVLTNEVATQHEPLAPGSATTTATTTTLKSHNGVPVWENENDVDGAATAPFMTIPLNGPDLDEPQEQGEQEEEGHTTVNSITIHEGDEAMSSLAFQPMNWQSNLDLETIDEDDDMKLTDRVVGCSKESLLQADYDELIRNINRMRDIIRNANTSSSQRSILAPDAPTTTTTSGTTYVGPPNHAGGGGTAHSPGGPGRLLPPMRGLRPPHNPLLPGQNHAQHANHQIHPHVHHHQVNTVDGLRPTDPPKIVVTVEKDLVVVGINARDRAGLLLDISKGLLRLDLQLHHTEAAVFIERSVSIWRCQVIGTDLPDVEQIWSVLHALLSADAGVEAIKERGLRVVRATVVKGSRLIGKTATEINFRQVYKTAIVALRQGGTNVPTANLATVRLDVGDILILQASDDSPLLNQPPANFYKELEESLAEQERAEQQHQHPLLMSHNHGGSSSGLLTRGTGSVSNLVKMIRRRSNSNLGSVGAGLGTSDDDEESGVSSSDATRQMGTASTKPLSSKATSATTTPTTITAPHTTAGIVKSEPPVPTSTNDTTNGTILPTLEGMEDVEGEMFFVGDEIPSSSNGDDDYSSGPFSAAEGGAANNTNTDVHEESLQADEPSDDITMHRKMQQEKVWQDLMVVFKEDGDSHGKAAASREFLTAMAIAPGSKFVGKTVAQGGIHKLPDLFLVSIERPRDQLGESQLEDTTSHHNAAAGNTMNSDFPRIAKFKHALLHRQAFLHTRSTSPHGGDEEGQHVGSDLQSVRTDHIAFEAIDPDEPLQEGDVLWFSGSASAVGDLRKIPGLVQYQNEEVEKINERVHDRRLVQAVVARNGPLVGQTVKELQFRTRFGAAVIAVHREGKRVHEHPGRIKLQAGDVLLLEAGPSFLGRSAENDRAFALLAEVKDSAPPRLDLLIPALAIAIAMLAVFTAGVTSILICALVAAVSMVALGILSEQEARDAFKWDIYITIACAFGIGNAMVNSGVAGGIANFLVDVGEAVGIGDAGLLGAVYFATFLISNVVTNNAAAALLFPIALDAAEQTGTDRIIMSYALMLGASASFMSPFGYTTNLLIYGPGGYKYNDFLRFGTPMQIILWILSTAFLVVEQWYISWVAMFFVLVLVSFLRIATRSTGNNNASSAVSTTAVASVRVAPTSRTVPPHSPPANSPTSASPSMNSSNLAK